MIFSCPNCNHPVETHDAHAGRKMGSCSSCGLGIYGKNDEVIQKLFENRDYVESAVRWIRERQKA